MVFILIQMGLNMKGNLIIIITLLLIETEKRINNMEMVKKFGLTVLNMKETIF